MGKSYVTKKNLFKFLLGSAFGILMFLVPIPQGGIIYNIVGLFKKLDQRLIWQQLKLYHYGDAGLFGGSKCV